MNSLDTMRAIHGRPRGYIDWSPQPKTLVVHEQVRRVLAEYEDYLPMTIRQIFYRLVTTFEYPKTEADYKRLCEMLNKARRAQIISFSAIRDDGFHQTDFVGWQGIEAAKHVFRSHALAFRLDRQIGQPRRLVVWCEAQGMVPQLERVCEPYSVHVFSSGGFDSVSVKHSVAQRFVEWGNVTVLHLGDHDPSGVHVYGSLDEDISAFMKNSGGDVMFFRLAVTPVQIRQFDLPTAPPKPTDRRNFSGDTVQCEALPPSKLAEILEEAIRAHLDQGIYSTALRSERAQREAPTDWLS